jgi:hypothetical protein
MKGLELKKTIQQTSKEEANKNFNLHKTNTSFVFSDLDEISLITTGDVSSDNLVDPIKILTEGVM